MQIRITTYWWAELGSFNPYDHHFGAAILLRRRADANAFDTMPLFQGLGRIADVVFEKFADASPPSFLFAEFGHRERGGIHFASSEIAGESDHRTSDAKVAIDTIDHRPGVVRVIPHDWDGDGKLDFAALVSQHYESVELFLNRDGKFQRTPIWRSDNLSFGSVALRKSISMAMEIWTCFTPTATASTTTLQT